MRRSLLLLVPGLLLALSACRTNEPLPTFTPTPAPKPTVVVSAPPTPTPAPAAPDWGIRISECANQHSDGTVLVRGTFSLPFIENADGNQAYTAINDYYLDLSAGLRTDTLDNTALAADDYTVAKAMEYEFLPYIDEESYELTYQSDAVASILRTHYAQSGGAYSATLYMADRFELDTGVHVSFVDCFEDTDVAAAMILDEIVHQGCESMDADTLKNRFQREYFYYTDEGLTFFYLPDPNAPHAAAAVEEFNVTYEFLGDRLILR